MLIFREIRAKRRLPLLRPLVALLCFALTGLWTIPASAVTPSGAQIVQNKASVTSSDIPGTTYSNTPASVTVDPVYGFAGNPFTATSSIPLTVSQGQPASYTFSITNNGNTTDQVYVILSSLDRSGSSSGAAWSVQVDDANPFAAGLTWQNSGTTSASASGDRATSGISLPPGGASQFSLRITGDGAPYGATMAFSITLETVGDTPSRPAGAYAGFNGQSYAGPGSVSSTNVVPTIPPTVDILSPADLTKTTQTGIAVTGITEPGVTGTITVTGPGTGQTSVSSLAIDGAGGFNRNVSLFAGQNLITVNVKDWNNNSASDFITVTSDPTPPVVSIEMNYEQAGPQVAITGKAYDALNNLLDYTVSYGAGTSPTTWKTIGTGSAPVGSASTNGTLATWNAAGLSGTYTIKLAAAEQAPYSRTSETTKTVLLTNLAQLSGTLPVGEWTMIALPGRPLNADPRAFLGNSRYEIQQWDPALPPNADMLQYKYNNIAISEAGRGFWVKPYEQSIGYSVQSYVTDTSQIVTLNLKNGWNQIGSPYLTRGGSSANFNWNQVQVKINAGTPQEQTKTMTAAIDAGWIDSQFYGYKNNGYVGYNTESSLAPYEGYFVKAYSDCQLVFDPGAGLPMGMARIIRPQYEWKMQIAAQTDNARDADNYAAMLAGALDNFDPADSSEPPTVEPYVSLYFENTGPENSAAKFARDTRPPTDRTSKTWNFIVKVSDPGKTVTVSAPNAKDLPDNYIYRIRDNATGVEFDPLSGYTYTSDGSDRSFTLRTEKTGDAVYITVAREFPSGWSLFSAPVEAQPTDVRGQLGDDLSRIQVFQYYDLEYYDPSHPLHVDIQAGIGYWIFLDRATRLDFEGYRTDPAKSIEIPLAAGWNLIGNPYETKVIDGDDLKVVRGGETLSLNEALGRGWLFPEIYEYNSSTGGYENHEIGTPMIPWKGYAIRAIEACTLIIAPAQD